MFGRKKQAKKINEIHTEDIEKSQLKRETRGRKTWALISSFLFLITVVFLILVEVGMTSPSRLSNVYFIKLDLSNIVPTSIPNSGLINTIAQTLGLHDFYQVGLWNYCAGFKNQGSVTCSEPKTLFWFNPIAVIQGELLAGASIPFPTEVQNILDLLQTASNWMFGLFLAGACMSFVLIFLTPLALYSKLATIPLAIFTFLGALCVVVACVLATAIFVIMRNAVRSQTSINIGAEIGVEMFAFMWVAGGAALFAFLIQLFLMCCCRSRRKAKKEWRRSMVDGGEEMRGGISPEHSHEGDKEDASSFRRA